MRHFLFVFFIIAFISLVFWTPKTAYALSCGDFVVESDSRCTRISGPTTKQLGSTCTYTESEYQCDNGVDPFVRCIRKNPDIDCGAGVTVCGGPTVNDGYNCQNWCLANAKVTNDTEQPGVVKTSNCKGCGHPGYPACSGSVVNPLQPNPNDTRLDCNDYIRGCLSGSNQQCSNAGSGCSTSWSGTSWNDVLNGSPASCTNACPGSPDVQCDPNHSCVFQVPVTQVATPTPTCTPVCPNSSDVACGTALGSDGCNGSCSGTGTKCPTNYACTTSGCQLKCGPWSNTCGAVTRTCDDGSTQNATLGPCTQGSCNVDSASATGTSTGTASVTCL